MNNQHDHNYVSVGQWMGLLLLTALPCVGVILVLVLAFAGDNDARKNYFRAILAWFLIVAGLGAALAFLGTLPAVVEQINNLIQTALNALP
ncbi:MAG: hypothetical protein PHR35_13270 [Kiritimatiellae bacterium]|nr:hypothetical protein [Kiritimatiellia bacterium]